MSPILVRPVREQLEHDRVIRLLQAKYKRKFEVAINLGNEQTAPVGPGTAPWYPDLVLQSGERGRRLAGVVEVETAESVNNLEAMSQWAAFSRLRVPFHLYIPAASVDTARRLCSDLQIPTTELWTYHALGEQVRFTLVQRSAQASDGRARAAESSGQSREPRVAAASARAASPSRAASGRSTRPAPSRPTRRPAAPAASPRRPPSAAKAKTAGPRRAAVKASARKPTSSSSRAQKRR